MKANSPPVVAPKPAAGTSTTPPAPTTRAGRTTGPPAHSHYLQSKIVRAIERIRVEKEAAEASELAVKDAVAGESAAAQPGVQAGAAGSTAAGGMPPPPFPPPPGAGGAA
jgi:hypothetical protein